jgi:hypothetical protein
LVKLPCNADLVCFVSVRGVWGLTCDFAEEFCCLFFKLLFLQWLAAALKTTAKARATAIDWLLRRSGFAPAFGKVVAALRRPLDSAEARLYPFKTKTIAKAKYGDSSLRSE